MLKEYNDKIEKEILEREKAKLAALQNAKQSNNEYEVEAILGKRTKKGKDGTTKTKYLIRWKGWGEEGKSSRSILLISIIINFDRRHLGT